MEEYARSMKLLKKYLWFKDIKEVIVYLVVIILILTGHIYGYKAGLNNGMVNICESQDQVLVNLEGHYFCYDVDDQRNQHDPTVLPDLSLEWG